MSRDRLRTGDEGRSGRGRTAAIIFVACLAGWLVMELEILGARMLTPYFGSTVYVMGSVIGVFLLSLAMGYMLGGWFSSRAGSKAALGVCLLAAGVWLCFLPLFAETACDRIEGTGVDERWGSLAAAFVLFSIPTVLMGTVSPTAVRWLTREAGRSGFTAGVVLCCSTVASFAGTIVTAFYLVGKSMKHTIVISGAALVATGAVILLHALLRPGTCHEASEER